jgi:hypothetical protein
MRLSLRGLALSFGILWGGCVFLVGLGNLVWPEYGTALLDIARSIYPGYGKTSGLWGVIVGTLYALLDGAIAGLIFGWLYNRLRGEDPGPAVIL